jgi:flagellar protein FliO/FliZ
MSPVAAYIVESLVTLLGVVMLAVVVLYGGRRLGIGRPSGPLELVGRLPLDARRAVYLVRVGKLVYVVGASEGGLTRLGEIDADSVPSAGQGAPPPRFADILAKIARPRADASRLTAPSSAPSQSEAPPPPPVEPSGHA